ncbi:MAG: DUF4292 domain-containing protein [Nitrospinae bacterium]|nr:DUF4292 domain-containing protein [Nitrospinota bacterium]
MNVRNKNVHRKGLFFWWIFSFTLYLFIPSGCAYKKVERITQPPRYPDVSVNQLIDSLKKRSEEIKDLSGIANIHIRSKNMNHKVKEVILVNGDYHIRLESLNIIGQPSLILVSDSNLVTAYNIDENRSYKGKASPEVISKMSGIFMSPRDIIELFTGRQFIENHTIYNFAQTKEDDSYILMNRFGNGKVSDEVWFEPINLCPTIVKRYDSSGKVMRIVTFSDYRRLGDHLFPFKIKIVLPDQGISMAIDYFDLELNTGVDESLFNLVIPEGAEAINLN